MKIDKTLISKLEQLANLELNPQEKERILADLNNMLGMVEKINELDTNGVEPLRHMSRQVNQWRADTVGEQLSQEDALSNAPLQDGRYFKVPKVIDDKK